MATAEEERVDALREAIFQEVSGIHEATEQMGGDPPRKLEKALDILHQAGVDLRRIR